MESCRRSHLTVLCLVVVLSASYGRSSSSIADDGEKVKLTLYYEALCPYCTNFIVNLLPELFHTGIDAIVDLKFSPYGNAKIRSNNTITCQHGPWECLLNTVEACAIDAWPDLSAYFPFLYCVESLIYEHKQDQWETCFEKLNLDSKPVIDCYKSGYGNELELKYAAEIKALQPPHTYVPWVTVDGQPLYDDYYNFLPFICKAYKGTNVPQACSNLSLNRIPIRKERANPIHPVCYKEETTKFSLSKITSAMKSWMGEVDMTASI